jgi:hypothetical protein
MKTYTIEYYLDGDCVLERIPATSVKGVTRSIEENGGDLHDVIAEK